VRFSALQDDFLKDRRARAFASAVLPIPRLVEIGEALGGFFAISERAHGAFLETLDADGMRRVLPSLFGALDAARQADISDSTGFGVWRGQDRNAPHATWREALLDVGNDRPSSRTHGWRARLEASPIGSDVFDQTLRRLEGLVDNCPETRHLVHSDLLYFNVLATDDRITAVLDWGSSLYGDFVYDIAWFTFWQPWYPAWRSIDFLNEASRHYVDIGLDVPAFGERLRAYELHIALDGMAYQAFTSRWADLEATTRRTLELDYP
jgi:hygromycin-B 4-O-kinase